MCIFPFIFVLALYSIDLRLYIQSLDIADKYHTEYLQCLHVNL